MRKRLIEPSCAGCPHDLSYLDSIPQRKFGVMMHCGEHYCTGGKRARRFKRSDPKTRVPQWCPRRKNPCGLRIYTLKNEDEWLLHHMLSQGMGHAASPAGHRYALRFEGTTQLSPCEFWRRCELEPAADLLSLQIELYEVLEIDDGLEPVYFYRTESGLVLERSFDRARAQSSAVWKGGGHP